MSVASPMWSQFLGKWGGLIRGGTDKMCAIVSWHW